MFSFSDPLHLPLLPQVGVLAEASRHQVSGRSSLWSDEARQEACNLQCSGAAVRPGSSDSGCSGPLQSHAAPLTAATPEIIARETTHAD